LFDAVKSARGNTGEVVGMVQLVSRRMVGVAGDIFGEPVPGGQEVKNEIVRDASEVTFNDLPPGQVKITVAARNSKGGESAPSDPVTATVT
jgi:hypothetical protein